MIRVLGFQMEGIAGRKRMIVGIKADIQGLSDVSFSSRDIEILADG